MDDGIKNHHPFFLSSGIDLSTLLACGKKVDNSPATDKNLKIRIQLYYNFFVRK